MKSRIFISPSKKKVGFKLWRNTVHIHISSIVHIPYIQIEIKKTNCYGTRSGVLQMYSMFAELNCYENYIRSGICLKKNKKCSSVTN